MKNNLLVVLFLFSLTLLTASCSPKNNLSGGPSAITDITKKSGDVSQTDPENPSTDSAQDQNQTAATTQVLLFNGVGTSVSDWKNLEVIINSMGLSYRLVNTTALNSMSFDTLKSYNLILIPGGNSNDIIYPLTLATKIRVRQAVRDGGVNFLGICAGAFAAVGVDAFSNSTAYYGFAVGQGDYLKHWYPNNNSSLVSAPTKVAFADGTERSLIWWDGPATPEWSHGVVARYTDGKPAISQSFTGAGFVIVSGPHPEAPPSWQYDSGTDPDGTDYDIAIKLIKAALYRKPLPVF